MSKQKARVVKHVNFREIPVKHLKERDTITVMGHSYFVKRVKKNSFDERVIEADFVGVRPYRKTHLTIILPKNTRVKANRMKAKDKRVDPTK